MRVAPRINGAFVLLGPGTAVATWLQMRRTFIIRVGKV